MPKFGIANSNVPKQAPILILGYWKGLGRWVQGRDLKKHKGTLANHYTPSLLPMGDAHAFGFIIAVSPSTREA